MKEPTEQLTAMLNALPGSSRGRRGWRCSAAGQQWCGCPRLPTLPGLQHALVRQGAVPLYSFDCCRCWYLMAQVGTQNKGTGHGHRATRSLVTKFALVQPTADCRSAGKRGFVLASADPELGQPGRQAGDDECDGQKS